MKAQQGELDAVIVYKKLSSILKEEEYKKTFLSIAADEGKHAAILKKYTEEKLIPKKLKANFVYIIYSIFGLKFTLGILEKGEFKAAEAYLPLQDKFKAIKEILDDEKRHGELMNNMKK
ncbi:MULTISPECIES: ferritin family protein [Clostridium]|uniref:ferritin family protein n=1 Tax=Clostridium TaxID=1485 RepID=UPI00098CD43A|nr:MULTISPECIES: ferritin family protein [Clostridium]AWV80317.1 hypothetical protein DK921_09450 [Clostridium acetobutylicum]MBC2392502.1 hypothetical protein [Clostridium acetobutylicum]MBC2583796.1 hypothetical protein [Clostridium acetobutylicum]PSM06119.1 hypothetical protein C7T89_09445 [Clostridium sp. NJ4]TQD49291.1 hypothetical protein FKV91_05795 [Clostridium acetobutylicum]